MAESLDTLLGELEEIRRAFSADVGSHVETKAIEELRVKYLGRKGAVSQYFKKMGQLAPADRPVLGDSLNKLKNELQEQIEQLQAQVGSNGKQADQLLDLTLPGTAPDIGYRNPLMQVLDEIKQIFNNMGFVVKTGPVVEDEYYNFRALNYPEDHPAMDSQDTFRLAGDLLLRSHTSPVQIRTMEAEKPPIRIIAPGRCFRRDTPDATHTAVFHQVEGLVVGEGISLAHLKGTLIAFAQKLFGEETKARFRPSFFPFTEPSAEMDIYFDDRLGWLEILGSGMVHPNVLAGVGIDPEKYTGFAFGMGVERIAMLKHQIGDIRHFYENDMRFLKQF